MPLEKLIHIIRENREAIRQCGVSEIGIFGSHARGEEIESSDLDIIAVFEEGKKTYDNLWALYELLQNLYHVKIDLVTPEGISKYIRPYIEKEAVYEKL